MKKMRKLIPAFAMLLVSAIMMSTASFAWFTMNDNVTATGMQVQAKSTGSLVISNVPLQDADKKTEVDLSNTANAVTSFKPITLDATGKWWEPNDGKKVDPITGKIPENEQLKEVTTPASDTYQDYILYIGSAGDTLTEQAITITLTAPVASAGNAYRAYSAAIYVISSANGFTKDDQTTVATNAVPAAIVHVDNAVEDGAARNVVTLKGTDGKGYTIPSVVGVQNDAYVGLKVVVRVFVDGDLGSTEGDGLTSQSWDVVTYTQVAADAKYDPDETYYLNAQGSEVANVTGYAEGADIPNDWFIKNVTQANDTYFKYVNSKDVPVTGSILAINFAAAKITTNNQQPSGQ